MVVGYGMGLRFSVLAALVWFFIVQGGPAHAQPATLTLRAALRQEAKERAKLFLAEFIFEFSQLEFTIRVALGRALDVGPIGWDDERFDAVTSPSDFAALCRVNSEPVDPAIRTTQLPRSIVKCGLSIGT